MIVAETGRIADWLTFAYENDESRYDELKEMIEKTYPNKFMELYHDICLCMQQRKYVS